MKKIISIAHCILLMLSSASVSSQTSERQPSISLPPGLQSVVSQYQTAWHAGDAKAIANLFAEDGFVLPNGSKTIRGREQIEQFYLNSGSPIILRPFAYQEGESLAVILGGITKANINHDLAKFTLTLRRKDNRWEIVSDMDNPSE